MRLIPKSTLTSFFLSTLAIFSSTRGYTILVLVFAQYLSARYILAPHRSWIDHLLDHQLFLLVLASSLAIAGGYLINNFYDAEKDRINRPQQYLLNQLLKPKQQLGFYALFNVLSLLFSLLVSPRACIFFLGYIGGIWLYSHVLKKTFWASNLFAAFLAITPFFAMGLYFDNLSTWVLYHASYLFLIILIRDLVKDLQNFKGDWVRGYQTTAVVFGERITKIILTFLILLSMGTVSLLLSEKSQLGGMYYYFLFCLPALLGIVFILWVAQSQKMYLWLHNGLKLLILAGVASIVLLRYPI
ncbi:MAG: geranylgeranylglycerol-phosphate geranylgeranyltransferase [Flavobacteriaceae bacterium]